MRRMSRHYGRLSRLLAWALAVAILPGVGCSSDTPDALSLFRAGKYAEALPGLMAEADSGNIPARTALATQYYLGLGTARDLPLAAKHFERAARAGDPLAQLNLGVLYLNGWGLAQDRVQASGWLQAAADAGNARALDYIATLTDKVTPNQVTAARERVRALLAAEGAAKPEGTAPR